MKYEQALKYLFILAVTIYAVTGFERWMGKESHESDIKREYYQKKEELKHKFYKYEIEQLKEDAAVDNMSDAELDSTWAVGFGDD